MTHIDQFLEDAKNNPKDRSKYLKIAAEFVQESPEQFEKYGGKEMLRYALLWMAKHDYFPTYKKIVKKKTQMVDFDLEATRRHILLEAVDQKFKPNESIDRYVRDRLKQAKKQYRKVVDTKTSYMYNMYVGLDMYCEDVEINGEGWDKFFVALVMYLKPHRECFQISEF